MPDFFPKRYEACHIRTDSGDLSGAVYVRTGANGPAARKCHDNNILFGRDQGRQINPAFRQDYAREKHRRRISENIDQGGIYE